MRSKPRVAPKPVPFAMNSTASNHDGDEDEDEDDDGYHCLKTYQTPGSVLCPWHTFIQNNLIGTYESYSLLSPFYR